MVPDTSKDNSLGHRQLQSRVDTAFQGQSEAAPTGASIADNERFAASVYAITAATREFCQAIESGDINQMLPLWERTRRVTCVLPGRSIKRGWQAVATEWLTELCEPSDVVVGNMALSIEGAVAWVSYDCDQITNSAGTTAAIHSVNSTTYACTQGEWFIVAHHASEVASSRPGNAWA